MGRGEDDGGAPDCEIGGDQPLLPASAKKRGDWRAPLVILAFECLESTAFYGVATNLVIYLTTVVHESNSSSITAVNAWTGTSYLTPLLGAFLADSFLGSYNTVLFSGIVYLIGMVTLTLSALLPSTTTAPGSATAALPPQLLPSASTVQSVALYSGLYLVAFGSGGVKASLLPLGADQYDDDDDHHVVDKPAFFSWFYVCLSVGSLISSTILVWVQEKISWALGFGLATSCIAIAFTAFLFASPIFIHRPPSGSPIKSLAQVIVASICKATIKLPRDPDLLYETESESSSPGRLKLGHTDQFRFFDKAAVVEHEFLLPPHKPPPTTGCSSWRLCTVTQVEELKMLLRTLPLWLTCVVYTVAYSQLSTTFIEQGHAMDTTLVFGDTSLSIPPAMLVALEVLFIIAWTLFYNRIVVPVSEKYTGNPRGLSLLQRMGVGRFLMILSMAAAALLENARLARTGESSSTSLSILWQIPHYFLIAGSEALNYVGQLEFFYEMSPVSMKSMGTAFYLLSISAGSYANSFLVSIIQRGTATDGRPGWIPDDLNKGHLDYFFSVLAAVSALNFVAHLVCSRIYKVDT